MDSEKTESRLLPAYPSLSGHTERPEVALRPRARLLFYGVGTGVGTCVGVGAGDGIAIGSIGITA